MKKGLIVLVLFILCFSTTALALQITYDSIQEEVLPGQSAKYLIHLTNNADEKVTVTIKTVDIIWGMDKMIEIQRYRRIPHRNNPPLLTLYCNVRSLHRKDHAETLWHHLPGCHRHHARNKDFTSARRRLPRHCRRVLQLFTDY